MSGRNVATTGGRRPGLGRDGPSSRGGAQGRGGAALLAIDHLAGPTAFDLLAWAGLALVVARIGRTGEVRWWLAGGVVLGLGLANKHSIGLFAVALLIGALLSGGRRLVWNRWFAAGALTAAAFTIPDIWWQAQHQWAAIAMTHALNQENGGLSNIGNWVIGQVIMTTLALVCVWLAGLRFLWRAKGPPLPAPAGGHRPPVLVFPPPPRAKNYFPARASILPRPARAAARGAPAGAARAGAGGPHPPSGTPPPAGGGRPPPPPPPPPPRGGGGPPVSGPPPPATPGPRCGHGCATTTDSRRRTWASQPSRCAGCARVSVPRRRWPGSIWRSRRVPSPGSSGRTVRGRPRPCR